MFRKSCLMMFVMLAIGCGKQSPTAPAEAVPAKSGPPDLSRVAYQQVGRTATGEGYVRWYGNLWVMENAISDWNGVLFNLYVTGRNGRVTKYIFDYGNSGAVIEGASYAATFIRGIDFGDAVNFELRVIPRGSTTQVQVRYGGAGFSSLPASMNITADGRTQGPLPPMD
jgi:hypothetical protein